MPLEECSKLWMYVLLGCLVAPPNPAGTARPRFDTSTDMGLVLVPADAEIDSVIFRLRATDQDADFPLVFDITATVTPVVRIENLPCTLYNKVCQANVILTRRLIPGRLHDFAVRVKDSKGDSNSMQATISVTNATTQRDKIFPHIPAIIMVPEDTKPGKELDYILVRSNQWSGKPVYIELWQPKELFTIRQRQTPAETRGVITLIGELDFETQSMYTLTMYATDPYTEPKKDTRNIAGLHLVVIVQDVQDVPPIFTLAPPLTKINNTVQPGDVILRVHAEDGDKGVPREVTYGLVSEGNPFTPFFNISETTGEIILARTLDELTQITHVGAPVVLTVVAEEIRRSTSEPPAQATVVEVGLLLGEPGNSPPFFENDNYVAWIDENAEPGTVITFSEHYSTKVRDEDIGKAGVFALKLDNNNGTFEINPTVAERTANFIITVRDNSLIDYETYKSLRFRIIAQEVGPATNLSAVVPATIFIRDINDNPPEFEAPSYEVTFSENIAAGTRVAQVQATDKDTGSFGRIQYTRIIGTGNEAFVIDPDTGIITVSMENSILDREVAPSLRLSVEARDEDGKGLRGTVPLIVNLLDVNDNAPIFEKENYEFTLNEDATNFTMPAIIKAVDADAEPPNNIVRYELIHGNYENKFHLNEITGELFLREPINKVRRTRHNPYQNFATKFRNGFIKVQKSFENMLPPSTSPPEVTGQPEPTQSSENFTNEFKMENTTSDEKVEILTIRKKREDDNAIFTLTARAYDLGVPHLSGVTQLKVIKGPVAGARIVSFVVPGENPNPTKTAETLAAITGGRISVQEIRPYTIKDVPKGSEANMPSLEGGKKSIVVARVEPNDGGSSLVDIERIRAALAANGVGVIGGGMSNMETGNEPKTTDGGSTSHSTNTNISITSIQNEEVTVYKAENRLLFWLLIVLGLLMLLALIILIICCICPGCPFYMAPRKRRVHSSETLIARSDGRPKRHLHRKPTRLLEGSWPGKKQAWSADPTRRNWQFNRRNQKACGLASLPGDVHVIDRDHEVLEKPGSLRLRDGQLTMYSTEHVRRPNEERIYIEDVEGMRGRGYVDVETLRQHEMERGLEMPRQVYVGQEERPHDQSKFVREQHFYRDGNAEVLRLVTRGQIEEAALHHQRPQTLVIDQDQSAAYRTDGKDILLQRFIEDQKIRHASGGQDLNDSFQDIEHRSMESHQRQKEAVNLQAQQQQQQQQQKILLIPERLEDDHRQHIEELGPDVQRLIIDHGSFEKSGRFEAKDNQELVQGATLLVHGLPGKVLVEKPKEQTSKQAVNLQHYSIHDLELARQNALLTRLLMERDGREVGGGAMIDSASYLETQSLPGQVAIATQTDRTAATQTELPNRSRSDNDESEEDARMRRKKSKKRYADGEPRKIRTLWMKSPIKEEEMQYGSEKRTNFLRRKIRDFKDSRRISLEPEVLREISDSLDENGDPPITARRRHDPDDSNSKEEYSNEGKGHPEDSSSMELRDGRSTVPEKREKHESVIEPSFRILEKEMSSLSKKLSRLAGKKMVLGSNESETDSQDRGKKSMMSGKKIERKIESIETRKAGKTGDVSKDKRSKSTPRTTLTESTSTKGTKIRDELVDKTRQPSKYRKSQTISTGSSDFEEIVERIKKPSPVVTRVEKQRQVLVKTSNAKLKRQGKVEYKEPTKMAHLALPQESAEGKDTSDSASKGSIKSWKSERDSMRTKRYGPGTLEPKSVQPGESSSSDNLKEKRGQRKERHVLERKSTVASSETSDKKSQERKSSGETSEKSDKKSQIRKSNGETSEHSDKTPKGGKSLAKVNETYGEQSQDETTQISQTKPSEKSFIEATVTEIERKVPEIPVLLLKTVPEAIEISKSEDFEKDEETRLEEIIGKKSDDSLQRELSESNEQTVLTVPKEEVIDFLAHETKDSTQSLQVHYHSISEEAENMKDIVLGLVAIEKQSEESPNVSKDEHISEGIKSEDSKDFKEREEIKTDEDEKMQRIVEETKVDQQSEEGEMFSDNFDSFSGTDLKGFGDTQGPKDQISYETLQSQSSEEQVSGDPVIHREDDTKIVEKRETIEGPIELSEGSQSMKLKEMPDSEELPTSENISIKTDEPSDHSPRKADSSTPVLHESPIPMQMEIKSETMPKDSGHEPEIKLETIVKVEETTDISKATVEPTESPKTEPAHLKIEEDPLKFVESHLKSEDLLHSTEGHLEKVQDHLESVESRLSSVEGHLKSVEAHIDLIPIVPPPDMKISDEKITAIEESSSTIPEAKSPGVTSPSHEEIIIEWPSQKEYGIADALFVDAKLLTVPSSPNKMVDESYVDVPRVEKTDESRMNVDVPTINLVELSRTMLEDAEDSDSSESSSKTMLTARPYGTPRHRPISGSEDIKPPKVVEDKFVDSETIEHVEPKEPPPEISPVSEQPSVMLQSPDKVEIVELPDESASKNQSKTPEIEKDTVISTPSLISEKDTTASTSDLPSKEDITPMPSDPVSTEAPEKSEPSPDVLPLPTVAEIPEMEPEFPKLDVQDDISKLESPTQEESEKEPATEKVQQLYQIRQETLPADADGFASLPETDTSKKSVEDSTELSEEMQIMEQTEGDHFLEEPETGAMDVPSTGVEMKLPVELKKETTDGVKKPDLRAKTKGMMRKKDSSKEDASRGVKKAHAVVTKTISPKKERKVKTMKDEASKVVKQTTVVGQLKRSRDPKQQERPARLKIEEVAEPLSRTDRVRRTWRKTDRPEKDVQPEEKGKLESPKKILPHEGDEKLVAKRPIETRLKREKLKDSRAKKIQEKTGKSESKKLIPLHTVERAEKGDENNEQETIEDSLGDETKDDEEIVHESKEQTDESKEPSIHEPQESRASSPVSRSEKEDEGDKKDLEEKPELPVKKSLEFPSLVEQAIDTEKVEPVSEETREQTSLLAEDKIEPVDIGKPTELYEEPSTSETSQPAMEFVDVASDKKDSKEVDLHSEDQIVEKLEKDETTADSNEDQFSTTPIAMEKTPTPRKVGKHRKEAEAPVIESQSRYMEWYKLKREEMERKRQERRDVDGEEERPKWLRKSTRQRWFKGGPDDKRIFDPKMPELTPSKRRKIKPLVNVESEQLKAIVRQGRKLRKAQGEKSDEPQIQIFAPEKPPTPLASISTSSRYHHHHHLVQHSEYKYEKMPPTPFYLHPPPVPHTSPQISPHPYEELIPEQDSSLPTDSGHPLERYEPGIVHQQPQGTNKLRHGQLLEKKSVFDIAYSEAAPSQLRSESTTPPS